MVARQSNAKADLTRLGWVWIAVLLIIAFGGWGAGRFNDATELTPVHDETYTILYVAAGVTGFVSMAVGFFQSRGPMWRRLVTSIVCFGGIGAIAISLLVVNVADIFWMKIDFPPARTQTYTADMQISRAYHRRHRRGDGWNIQIMPIFSDLSISHADYIFMRSHRRPGDTTANPDEISSQGYFCATMTLQKSGDAIRILHAGNYELPSGTVRICPIAAKNNS